MAVKENVILDLTSDRFEDWKKHFVEDKEFDGIDISDMTIDDYWESFHTDNRVWAEEVESWLNQKLNGVIVAFAKLEFWNGRTNGAKKFNNNLNSIIDICGCDTGKWYADRYNVKAELRHHDGTHNLTYRLVPYEKVDNIMYLASIGSLTWEYFRKNSKSIKNNVKVAMLGE